MDLKVLIGHLVLVHHHAQVIAEIAANHPLQGLFLGEAKALPPGFVPKHADCVANLIPLTSHIYITTGIELVLSINTEFQFKVCKKNKM